MNSTVARFLKLSIAIENGLLAAGATIIVVTLVQSIFIVTGWLR